MYSKFIFLRRFSVQIIFFAIFASTTFSLDVDEVQKSIEGINSSFSANFSYSSSTGEMISGKIYYEYPNKLNVQFSDGKVMATNGKYLWVYDPETKICARQAVKEDTVGGIFYFLHGGYSVQETNGRYTFKRPEVALSEVNLKVEDRKLKSIQLKVKDEVINMSFSNIVTDASLKASLFNYKPNSEAQMVENPLNRVGNINIMMQNQTNQTKE